MNKGQRNLIGNKYGKLTVISMLGKINPYSPHYYSRVKCECGNELDVRDTLLIHGKKTCCHECWRKNLGRHHLTGTRIHNIWSSMRQRCNNSNSKSYGDYGGRGIRVCEEWNKSFEAFYEWAMANGYSDNLTIDRIDVNGNYEPSNCRWVTGFQQASNKRNNTYIHYDGEILTVSEVARRSGISQGVLSNRIRQGWNEYDASHAPIYKGFAVRVKDMNTNEVYTFSSMTRASQFIGKCKHYIWNRISKANCKSLVIGDYYVEVEK